MPKKHWSPSVANRRIGNRAHRSVLFRYPCNRLLKVGPGQKLFELAVLLEKKCIALHRFNFARSRHTILLRQQSLGSGREGSLEVYLQRLRCLQSLDVGLNQFHLMQPIAHYQLRCRWLINRLHNLHPRQFRRTGSIVLRVTRLLLGSALPRRFCLASDRMDSIPSWIDSVGLVGKQQPVGGVSLFPT